MKRVSTLTIMALFVAVFAVCVPQAVLAAGTTANTSVANTVVLNWNAGAVANSTTDTATFVVDRLVTFTVTNETSPALTVDVLPGVTGAVPDVNVLAFGVYNASNTTLDFALSALNSGVVFSSNVAVYIDSNLDRLFDAGDPIAASLDDVPADTAYYVFVVADISSGASTPDVQNVDLQAQALTAVGGTVITASAGPWAASTLQSVLFDAAGTAAADIADDGLHSDRGYYQVTMPSLTVSKSADVISDGLGNVSPNAMAIPGATVRYVIQIDNTGSGSATGVTVVDVIPAGTTYVAGSLYIGGVVDPNDAAAPGDYNVTNALAVTAPLAAPLAAAGSTTVGFSVLIDPI
jgi:uncharacterized repeat protein (TIGR01451 family)